MKHSNNKITHATTTRHMQISTKSQLGECLIHVNGNGNLISVYTVDPNELRAIAHAFNEAAAEMEGRESVAKEIELDHSQIEVFGTVDNDEWIGLSTTDPGNDETFLRFWNIDDMQQFIKLLYWGWVNRNE